MYKGEIKKYKGDKKVFQSQSLLPPFLLSLLFLFIFSAYYSEFLIWYRNFWSLLYLYCIFVIFLCDIGTSGACLKTEVSGNTDQMKIPTWHRNFWSLLYLYCISVNFLCDIGTSGACLKIEVSGSTDQMKIPTWHRNFLSLLFSINTATLLVKESVNQRILDWKHQPNL